MKKNLVLSALAAIAGMLCASAASSVRYLGPGGIPTPQDFEKYRVTDPNQSEVIRQTLYDTQLYPAAGLQNFTFFTQGVGNGKTSTPGATAGSPKQLSDTNMNLNGQLPSGMQFLAETLEVLFIPGNTATADTFIPANPTTSATGVLGAQSVSAINDVSLFYNTGLLQLAILNKTQLQETPLRLFPPRTFLELDASFAAADTNATTAVRLAALNMRVTGRTYYLEPMISLQPASNFTVSISYPTAQALPSGFNGRIKVSFDGYLQRASQ